MSERPPYICEPTDKSAGRPATFIFLHGYGDDAEGLPMGLAQQFQFNNKLPYLRWLLPNAPHNHEAMTRAWFIPKALPSALKPRVPGHAEEDESALDDEEGILDSAKIVDRLVQEEIERGVEPGRIIVGGFSQGCAVSLIWGLTGQNRNKVGGLVCMSGYLPMADRIASLRDSQSSNFDKSERKWFYVHGSKDMLVPTRLFEAGKQELAKWTEEDEVETHLYDGMSHSTAGAELRDLLIWLEKVIPA